MHNTETITDRIVLVMLGISIWSGRKKLKPEDLNLLDGEIPPEELVSLGSKRVCDPEPLKPFHRLKQSAERACLRVGTRFLGGFAVPKAHAEDLATQLDVLRAEFDAETQTFLAGYDRALEDWIAKLPAFEAAIRRAVEPAQVVGGRLRFGYQLVQIKPAEQPGTLTEEVQQLGNGIFAEVEQMARDLEGSFAGKDRLHRRALGTFNRIRDKLACLSFVDGRIQPVVDSIEDWLGRLPLTAPITGALFNEGMGLALLLSDAERMAQHGAGQLAQAGHSEEDACAAPPPPTAPVDAPAQMPLAAFEAELASLFEDAGDVAQEVSPSPTTEAPTTEADAVKPSQSFFF
ncbi:DUF3150 domain-containing protein [uncultured Thiohalocapsa sp.]|uniref:DUF3150 domain-containing protein n=1 Tax=uncultured Thiohalocapsa sp. TaxID=768990 RepID=UPI0025CE0B7C|nr:DUF3150 domain-containing protein [uncultured Thiohalocapsa sp.]